MEEKWWAHEIARDCEGSDITDRLDDAEEARAIGNKFARAGDWSCAVIEYSRGLSLTPAPDARAMCLPTARSGRTTQNSTEH